MRSKLTRSFATRLPAEQAELLNSAIDETGSTKAELLRRAVTYYINLNPDHLLSLETDDTVLGFILDMERDLDE
jgi:predicted DNA-binding protein